MTSGSPKVVVVIPCYNRGEYIEDTVKSVLGQTYENIELVVVDDGSTDDSLQKLEAMGDAITLLRHPGGVNKGQSASINLGIRSSESKYLAVLDSDDLFEKDKIALQVGYLEAHEDVGIVYGNGHVLNMVNGKRYPIYGKDHVELSDPNRILMDCYFLLPNNALVRREAYDRAGLYNESYRSAQDHDMAVRLMEKTKIAYIEDYVFTYRKHKDSISYKNTEVRWTNGFKILKSARKRYPYKSSAIRKRYAVLCFRMGQVNVGKGSFLKAGLYFALSGLADPVRAIGVISGREKTGGLN